ncbi:MAG: methyltransferase domain-containing protein [Flavobacteriales bacterium]|nr:methyltransferase domain-containing protein [Flavobacteriales bacterium]
MRHGPSYAPYRPAAGQVRTYVATDINPAMLEFAKQQLPNEDIEWNAVDAVSLPYPDKSLTWWWCSSVV